MSTKTGAPTRISLALSFFNRVRSLVFHSGETIKRQRNKPFSLVSKPLEKFLIDLKTLKTSCLVLSHNVFTV